MSDLAQEYEEMMEQAREMYPEVDDILRMMDEIQPLLDECDRVYALLHPPPQTITTNHTGPLDPDLGV